MSDLDSHADGGLLMPGNLQPSDLPTEVAPERTIDEIADSIRPDGANAEEWRDETLEAVTQLSIPQEISHPSALMTVGSFVLFVVTLGFWLGWELTPYISGLIIIHEAGHYVLKKLFGYQDIQLFFIPFIGAAVSGRKDNASQVERALIALAGPVPGVLVAAAFLYAHYQHPHFQMSPLAVGIATLSILLNGFNLIPLVPLDGGQFFSAILFSRRPWMETACKMLAVAALVFFGTGSPWISFAIAAFIALSIRTTHNIAVLSQRLRVAGLNRDASLEEMSLEHLVQSYALSFDLVDSRSASTLERRVALRAGLLQRAYPGALAKPAPAVWVALLLTFYLFVCGFGGYTYWLHEKAVAERQAVPADQDMLEPGEQKFDILN